MFGFLPNGQLDPIFSNNMSSKSSEPNMATPSKVDDYSYNTLISNNSSGNKSST